MRIAKETFDQENMLFQKYLKEKSSDFVYSSIFTIMKQNIVYGAVRAFHKYNIKLGKKVKYS